jgi:hypothetical protein
VAEDRPDRRQPGVRRWMFYAPARSSARCETCGHDLRDQANPKTAGRAAREHTQETGHPTRVLHVQVVDYERE